MKTYEIWIEGFTATGQSQSASKIGEGAGNNFDEAVKDYMSKTKEHEIEKNERCGYISDDAYKNRRSNWNIWARSLFNNEIDAKKGFG